MLEEPSNSVSLRERSNTQKTYVRRHAVDPMQRSCYQSIAMARDVLMRQEQWRDVWKKAWVRNQCNWTTHCTLGLVANSTRCLQKMEGGVTGCLHEEPDRLQNISLIKEED